MPAPTATGRPLEASGHTAAPVARRRTLWPCAPACYATLKCIFAVASLRPPPAVAPREGTDTNKLLINNKRGPQRIGAEAAPAQKWQTGGMDVRAAGRYEASRLAAAFRRVRRAARGALLFVCLCLIAAAAGDGAADQRAVGARRQATTSSSTLRLSQGTRLRRRHKPVRWLDCRAHKV